MDGINDERVLIFLDDPLFRNWVLHPTKESERYWSDWLNANPDQAQILEEARNLLVAIEVRFDRHSNPAEEIVKEDLAKIRTRLKEPSVVARRFRLIRFLRGAAAAVLLASGLAVGWQIYRSSISPDKSDEIPHAQDRFLRIENTLSTSRTVLLEDGSMVILEKGSALRFPEMFGVKSRMVYLEGDAFFDIAKNPARPFLVYAGRTVTKVLGTSFRIQTLPEEGTVLVAVRTGKVSVYSREDFEMQTVGETSKATRIELSPDEQVVFDGGATRMKKDIVRDHRTILSAPDLKELTFEDRPVAEILDKLASVYGIEIRITNDKLTNYTLTTQFKEEGLRQRLDVICDAIDATYTVENGVILIKANTL